MTRISKSKILKLVSDELQKVRLDEITLDVLNGEIEKRDDTWYVPVRASAQPPTMYPYYDALANIETDLLEKYDLNVWLIPNVPEHAGDVKDVSVENGRPKLRKRAMKVLPKKKVLELVSKRLRQERVGEITFDVLNGEIAKRDDAWHLPVRPSAQPPRMYEYYDALANVEADLLEKYNLDVWLIPTVPD